MRKRSKVFNFWTLMILIVIVFYGLFFLYPIGTLLREAVIQPVTGALTFEHFEKFFERRYYFQTIINTFKVTSIATVLTLAIGVPLAYFTNIYKIKGKRFINIAIIMASMSAPFIGAYSWILLLGRNGLITNFFQNYLNITIPDIYGFNGILLVFTLQLFPLVYLYTQGALSNVDNTLFEASESMGVTGVKRFFKIVLPLIRPTVFASGLLVFMNAFADFGTPMLIGEGYRTFSRLIFDAFVGEVGTDAGFAAAISVIAILVTTTVFLVQRYLSNRKQFSMSALHSIQAQEMKRGQSILVHTFVYGFVGLAFMP
ncbi:MAG TPA: ABC transporter permease subunit, partial [Erysipelothrix sp.]|nr:ABC transporter permease subunit [Erysipelothrix sp.]